MGLKSEVLNNYSNHILSSSKGGENVVINDDEDDFKSCNPGTMSQISKHGQNI